MRKINITVRDNTVAVKYRHGKKVREFEWEDCRDLTRKFLARFDKINKCNKNISNCLFVRRSRIKLRDKSGLSKRPNEFVLTRAGSESTTWRIVLVNLRALEWAGRIKLVENLK